MNSTIHELYFSDINFNYVFELLRKLILNETNVDINNKKYLTIYKLNYPKYFNDNDIDNISTLNKLLLDDIGDIILKDISKTNHTTTAAISYDILKCKPVIVDKMEYVCVKLSSHENNKIKNNDNVDFFCDKRYLNTLSCQNKMENYLFFFQNDFNISSNKLAISI
tara:strand:+ start:295 stop:792 length:498 start_codon:yes stop_codon:yes gene_type:complete